MQVQFTFNITKNNAEEIKVIAYKMYEFELIDFYAYNEYIKQIENNIA